jgi:MraZ protein
MILKQPDCIYVGEYYHSLDVKNRLTIPSKWRGMASNVDTYLVLLNPIGCITIYPPKMIGRLETIVSTIGLGDAQGQKTLAKLFSQADTLDCDKQGRVNFIER